MDQIDRLGVLKVVGEWDEWFDRKDKVNIGISGSKLLMERLAKVMATTEEVKAAAERLAELLKEHPAVAAARAAETAIQEDDEARELMKSYQEHIAMLEQKQRSMQPIEVEEKRKAEELKLKVGGNEKIKAWEKVQMDYWDLMRMVNGVLGSG